MRPLYVKGRGDGRWRAKDGSLVYERPGQAAVRFPLERVSRVVVRGRAGWGEEVLRACAAGGVVVALLDADGNPEGFLLPWRKKQLKPGQMLEEFLHRRDWQWRFENWRRSEERRAIFKVLPAARQHAPLRAPDRARQALEAWVGDRRGVALIEKWKPLLAAVVHSKLCEEGLSPAAPGGKKGALDLAGVFCHLLGWHHYRHAKDCCVAPEAWFEEVSAYERIRERDEQRAVAMCRRFVAWLGEQEWE
ncbi:MAG: CRISPR-associated endonuclease Cas1 [Bryobacteraceae bacterium]